MARAWPIADLCQVQVRWISLAPSPLSLHVAPDPHTAYATQKSGSIIVAVLSLSLTSCCDFVNRPLLNDTFNATGSIDGKPLIVRKGYNSIVRSPQRFIGYWADATGLVKPGSKQTLKLKLPGSGHDGYVVENGFINQGNDAGAGNMTVGEAEKQCSAQDSCVGFTFEKTASEAKSSCNAITGTQKILFKSAMSGSSAPTWCKLLKPASPVGVFFENVQPLTGSFVVWP